MRAGFKEIVWRQCDVEKEIIWQKIGNIPVKRKVLIAVQRDLYVSISLILS